MVCLNRTKLMIQSLQTFGSNQNRTVQLIGRSYTLGNEIKLTIYYDNVQVYALPIPITNQARLPKRSTPAPKDTFVLAQWLLPNTRFGLIPVSISVTGDDSAGIEFQELRFNFTNRCRVATFTQNGLPVECYTLTNYEGELFATPQIDTIKHQLQYDEWGNDGKYNVRLNGNLIQHRNLKHMTMFRDANVGVMYGSYHNTIPAGSTLSLDYHVDHLQFLNPDEHRKQLEQLQTCYYQRTWGERHFDESGPMLWIERKWPQINS